MQGGKALTGTQEEIRRFDPWAAALLKISDTEILATTATVVPMLIRTSKD